MSGFFIDKTAAPSGLGIFVLVCGFEKTVIPSGFFSCNFFISMLIP